MFRHVNRHRTARAPDVIATSSPYENPRVLLVAERRLNPDEVMKTPAKATASNVATCAGGPILSKNFTKAMRRISKALVLPIKNSHGTTSAATWDRIQCESMGGVSANQRRFVFRRVYMGVCTAGRSLVAQEEMACSSFLDSNPTLQFSGNHGSESRIAAPGWRAAILELD